MKNNKLYISVLLTGVLLFVLPACKKEFLNRPPIDAISIDNFYSTADQVNASTSVLYNLPWFDLNDKALWGLGDVGSGNLTTFDQNVVSFKTFNVTADNATVALIWSSLFQVVGMSNSVINNLPVRVAPGVDKALVNRCVGEARFMRALAYFYLVRTFGAVPIVENGLDFVYKPLVPRNIVDDVYKFILLDLEYAEANCPLRSSYGGVNVARVSSGTAKALQAKVYLYLKNYPKARAKAEEVINSGEYGLMPNYADIFKTQNNANLNPLNKEAIFALLWDIDPSGRSYGSQNSNQGYFAAYGQGLTGFDDGYGSGVPTIDLQNAYESGDKRKKAVMMTPGDFYPELLQAQGGYTYPTTNIPSNTRANIKKYVVGTPADNGGKGAKLSTYVNTNILRYADVLLIAAEAILNGAPSTSDANALKYFNLVRERAGLPDNTIITSDDILHERRVELAFEADYWFDLGRIDRDKAISIIENQERGFWDATGKIIYSYKHKPVNSDFLLPIPATEISQNPRFKEAPVTYPFK